MRRTFISRQQRLQLQYMYQVAVVAHRSVHTLAFSPKEPSLSLYLLQLQHVTRSKERKRERECDLVWWLLLLSSMAEPSNCGGMRYGQSRPGVRQQLDSITAPFIVYHLCPSLSVLNWSFREWNLLKQSNIQSLGILVHFRQLSQNSVQAQRFWAPMTPLYTIVEVGQGDCMNCPTPTLALRLEVSPIEHIGHFIYV